MKSLFAKHIDLLDRVMDLRLQRQNIVAGNLANLSNPAYKARRLEFEEELQAELRLDGSGDMTRTHERHMPVKGEVGYKPNFYKEYEVKVIQGEDSVDLDKEMAIQSKNTLLYITLAEVMRKSFSGMEEVITKGGQ
jgi:flagellar basal-body rod protein FlgB